MPAPASTPVPASTPAPAAGAAVVASPTAQPAAATPKSGGHYEAGFNLTMPPFDNKKLRQALSDAVDKQRFVDTILGGVGASESLSWLPAAPAYGVSPTSSSTSWPIRSTR
jgi:peptide/nickel transport system substrate-binding protein